MAIILKKYITKRGKDIPYLYQDDRGNFWARKRFGDSTPRISLETDVESIAIAKIHEYLKALENRVLTNGEQNKISGDTLLFRDFYDKMIAQKKSEELKASTLNRIDIIWRHSIEPFWGNLTKNDINQDIKLKFIDWHKENREDIQFVNVFKYLNNILRVMFEAGEIQIQNLPRFKVPKNEQRHHGTQKGTVLLKSEFNKIESCFDEKYRLLVTLAYELGMRQMELGSLECDRVIKNKEMVCIDLSAYDTKTGIPRLIPVPLKYHSELLKRKSSNKKYIFESPTSKDRHVSAKMIFAMWKRAKTMAKIKRAIRFHDLRHTRATILVKNNHNPLLISSFLGMSIKTLQNKYLKLKPEDLLILLKNDLNLNSEVASE